MATDPQSLLTAANCYNCADAGPGTTQLMKLALLQQILIALNPVADTSPQGLLEAATCYRCYGSSPGLMSLMELALLAQISANGTGGGGGGGGATNPPPGVVNPNGNVTGAPGAFYFNTANFTVWVQAGAVTANTGWIQTQ